MKPFATCLLLAAALATPAAHAADVVLTMNSYGSIRVGMPVAEVHQQLRKLGRKDLPSPRKVAATGCGRYEASKELGFMTEDGKIVRIETSEANVVTPSGIRVGSSIEKVRHTLGSRVEDMPQPHSNDPLDRSLVLVSGDQQFAIRVDAGQQVTRIQAGAAHAVRHAGACG